MNRILMLLALFCQSVSAQIQYPDFSSGEDSRGGVMITNPIADNLYKVWVLSPEFENYQRNLEIAQNDENCIIEDQYLRQVASFYSDHQDVDLTVDESTFVEIKYIGREETDIYERVGRGWHTNNVFVFEARWEDGGLTKILCNSDFSFAEAERYAEYIARVHGTNPKFARDELRGIVVNNSGGSGGGGTTTVYSMPQNINYSNGTILNGEELFLHEAAHGVLDNLAYLDSQFSEKWYAAAVEDADFLTNYARNYPSREDMAETIISWLGMRYAPERLPQKHIDRANSVAFNRLALIDQLDLDPYPVGKPMATKYIDQLSSKVSYQPSVDKWLKAPKWNNVNSPEVVFDVKGTFEGGIHYSKEVGASATFSFTGSKATLFGTVGEAFGIAEVYLDGKYMRDIDFYRNKLEHFQPLYTTPTLPVGEHKISFVVTGRHNPLSNSTNAGITIDVLSYESGDVNDLTPPSAPSNLVATNGFDRVFLDWDDNEEADIHSYNVYRYADDGFRAKIGPAQKESCFFDYNFPNPREYQYEVTSVDSRGRESEPRRIIGTPTVTLSDFKIDATSDRLDWIYEKSGSENISYSTGDWGSWSRGHFTYPTAVGASATFSFTGVKAQYLADVRTDGGMVNIYLDGEFVKKVDLYNLKSDIGNVSLIYETPYLVEGSHTIRVEQAGTSNEVALEQDHQIFINGFKYIQGNGFSVVNVTPYSNVNAQGWTGASEINLKVGDSVRFGPWPYWGDFKWFWTGPTRFRHVGRDLTLGDVNQLQAGVYTAYCVDEAGKKFGSYKFTVNVSDPRVPTRVSPYTKVNSQDPTNASIATVSEGDAITISGTVFQQAQGSWTWSHPDGSTSTDRRLTMNNVSADQAGVYDLTFTRNDGRVTEYEFLVNVKEEIAEASLNQQDYGYIFDGERGTEGWSRLNNTLSLIQVEDSFLKVEAVGTDQQIESGSLGFLGEAGSYVAVSFRSNASGPLDLFWKNEDGSFGGGRSSRANVNYNANSGFQTLYFDLRDNVNWTGKTISSLRLDPPGSSGTVTEIDYIDLNAQYSNVDSDGDGASDVLELGYGRDPYSDKEATMDTDNDGYSDLFEILSGFSPDDQGRNISIKLDDMADGNRSLEFETQPNRSYRIYRSTLLKEDWTLYKVINTNAQESGLMQDFNPDDLKPGDKEFYRISVDYLNAPE